MRSMDYVATRSHVDIHDLYYQERSFSCLWSVLLPEAMPISVDCVATGCYVDMSSLCYHLRVYYKQN